MNAIIGLCHFCEAHGPRPLFCTFTTDNEKHITESSKSGVQCGGCTSLGPETVFMSKDDDGTIFCSRESVPNADVTAFLRQAAIRSITCEVNWSKEGGVVYFSDTYGHVLSLTFQVKDTWARGLKRWFSIVVLMKDKMLLLNITPSLSEHMQRISKELQDLAEVVYDAEQKVCSQRALRLKTGRNDFGQSRSLMHLTGNQDVFKKLHSQFTWMLKAGAHTYSETLYTSQNLLKKLQPQALKNSIFDANTWSVPSIEECMSLRCLEKMLSKEIFRVLMYCVLVGVPISIKSNKTDAVMIMKSLSRLLPISLSSYPLIRQAKNDDSQINTCCVEELENDTFIRKWTETLPLKCPTLMIRIENAMNNDKFNSDVLQQHVKSLQLEWLGIAKALKPAVQSSGAKSDAVMKLKQILGVAQHDESLINHWMNTFCA